MASALSSYPLILSPWSSGKAEYCKNNVYNIGMSIWFHLVKFGTLIVWVSWPPLAHFLLTFFFTRSCHSKNACRCLRIEGKTKRKEKAVVSSWTTGCYLTSFWISVPGKLIRRLQMQRLGQCHWLVTFLLIKGLLFQWGLWCASCSLWLACKSVSEFALLVS